MEPAAPCDWLLQAAQCRPRAPALLGPTASLDYAGMLERTRRLAAALREPGSSAEVLVVQTRDSEFLVCLLHAALLGGRALMPLDPDLPPGWRADLLAALPSHRLIRDGDAAGDGMTPGELLEAAAMAEPIDLPPAQPPLSARLWLSTSGSGGRPKLVALGDAALAASVEAVNRRLRLAPSDLWLACLPLFHVGGLSVLLRCAAAGAAVRLHGRFDAAAVARDLERQPVSHLSLVPAMLARLLEAGAQPPASLRVVLVGGGPLSPALAERALAAGWPLWVTYGMTETASQVAARPLALGEDPACVGTPLPGFAVRLLDAAGQPGASEGVIELQTPWMEAGEWLHTGDRGRLDELGRLSLLGRADQALLSGGETVQPEAVEGLLAACPGVAGVAVSGHRDPVWGEVLVAFYRGSAGPSAVEDWCRTHLAGALRPRIIRQVSELPQTASGKLDRRRLRRWAEEGLSKRGGG
ncbi:AMP-binding protein [Thiohalobacter sp. IOR34]|uniref:class I adenylate-forming enzyme family protein n=1 Tax=Thiohalobacter sp. IOR34 TaxID=3057176 RepID=UPI0025AFDE1A|nr:AMP-binding protein [Thiohalobacter sp. IOR34]WJW75965.1 AMP-binding protein [Thiohalobacter sp. IOR34]